MREIPASTASVCAFCEFESPSIRAPVITSNSRLRLGSRMITGFSPRKGDLTLYIMPGFDLFPDVMKRLGKYKTGKSCLYIKKLGDVDVTVLRELVVKAVNKMAAKRIQK